ncbi:hypothetical protein [Streptomyces scabiei]|uniref:Uncharacterized protein n=1 Tax=Streptomyces scabiei TaxID=1930 RepID=A0A117EEJ1_STRSC|nr:hypothetical protein [Streptomyces scabiei]GAQ64100.1 hypothetical protein SsS58_04490 [Streptomyces scabiei]
MNDASLQIAAVLSGAALAAAFIKALTILRRHRYQAPASEPYAGFQSGAHTGTGELLRLACQGDCPGTTTHEADGDGTAACFWCGAIRPVPVPDEA